MGSRAPCGFSTPPGISHSWPSSQPWEEAGNPARRAVGNTEAAALHRSCLAFSLPAAIASFHPPAPPQLEACAAVAAAAGGGRKWVLDPPGPGHLADGHTHPL
ncbi:rCG22976 [Rattus norvegicus]|uniref:RCG22976 n=1 Tax=Rattus norvegicus TaxID=10116 RepID=A6KB16_RAT|nr:rCG22976 [Rattus norvegicus]